MARKLTRWGYVKRITTEIVRHPANRGRPVRSLARAVGWQVRKRITSRPRVVDYAGFRLRCWPDSQSASNLFYFSDRYDYDEMAFIERYLRPGDQVLDIGANIGTYTLLAASLVGPAGHVDAFEPQPLAAQRLRQTVAENRLEARVVVHEAAVADRSGRLSLQTAYDVANALVPVEGGGDRDGSFGPTVEVDAVALDDVVEPRVELRLAKLDVEGAEDLALAGAGGLLAAGCPPVWITEVYDWLLVKLGSDAATLIGRFEAAGYQMLRYCADEGELRQVAVDDVGFDNVIFVHADHLDAVRRRVGAASGVP